MRPRPPRGVRPKVAYPWKLSPEEGPTAHQLVGEVTAHQGKDG
jgi:hypothetical protein